MGASVIIPARPDIEDDVDTCVSYLRAQLSDRYPGDEVATAGCQQRKIDCE